jgi:predicted regulator of amino acid metabolism with ACT domain
MQWNITMAVVSIALLLLFVGAGLTAIPMTQAEAIADQLAPEIGADRNVVRVNLERILADSQIRRVAVACSPLALLSVLLTARVIADSLARTAADKKKDIGN